ncbi:DUF3105 domain-containing protein [Candidatus Microgenomates bacterium]|nr:DUF3105 domain-containing protein [Candidatus Microgenomates bacterium]
MDDLENLPRRERRRLLREQQREQEGKRGVAAGARNWIIGLLIIVLFAAGVWWFYKESTKPLPGQAVADLGREHVTDISDVTYNSNPPTSGKHFPVWAKRGMYDRVLSDGYLLHSLEHGYVVASYNCDKLKVQSVKFKVISRVFAHETEEPHEEPVDATPSGEIKPLTRMTVQTKAGMSWFTPEDPPSIEVELPESFKSESCKNLVDELSQIAKGYDRVIVVPRVDLDTPIALTAWGRIEKMDSFDRERIKTFISAFHNKGPEKTQE